MNPSTTPIQAELPPPEISRNTAMPHVGQIQTAVSETSDIEHELDDAITELGRCSERAMADGDPAGARIYNDRMVAAIRSRTPEHQARLTSEVEARIADELSFNGDWSRRRVG